MTLRSILSALRDKWPSSTAKRRLPRLKTRNRPLGLERLEPRELLSATPPRILSVTPPDQGSSVETASPNTIVVQYNEAMFAGDQVPANYALFGPGGAPVAISSVTADGTLTNAYDVTYAAGQVGGAYTLFVQGDKVHEATDTVALAQPGQLVVANGGAGQSTVSTINAVTGTTPLNAVQTYPMGQGLDPFGTPTPTAVVVADFNGDGIPDLAVANNNTAGGGSEVDIYAGKAGGGFNATPDASLPLALVDTATGALIAFNPLGAVSATGFADLAVADPTNGHIDIFVNNGTTGVPSFAPAVSYVSGATTPVGLAAGDFNNDGNTDLAVVDGASANVDFLPGNGDGTFGAKTTVALTGLQNPTSIAAGSLATANSADLAFGGSNGVVTLINSGTVGAFTFTVNGPYNSTSATGLLNNVSSVAIGNINGDGFNDVVASSSTSSNVEVLANADDGSGTINAALSQTFSLGTVFGNLVSLSTGTSGLADIVTANTAANEVTVLQNTSSPATFSFAAAAHYTVDAKPIALAIGAVNGDASPDVITANTGIGFNQGGTFSVLRNKGDGTYLVSAPLPEAANAQPDAVAVGDLNGDGIPDLVVANFNTNTVSVYLATAPGVYAAPVVYSITDLGGHGNGPVSVTLANLTGNPNQLDIITADRDGYVSVLANNGSGSFAQAVTFAVGNNPTQVVAGKFDGSGNVSLAVSHNGAGAAQTARGVTLLLGNGNRTFQAGQEIAAAANVAATALVAGNFISTAPGAPLDLAVANDATSSVILLQNNGSGVFTQQGSFAVGPHPSALAAADFNRDGFLDVVAVSKDITNGTQQISVLLNSAGSGFAPAVTTPLPFNFPIQSVAVTDVNGDAFPDLVVGLTGTPTRPTQNAPADANFYVLTGNGDGSFGNPIPYMAGGAASSTVVGVVSDPFVHITTFHLVSNIVNVNLIQNGGFEGKDLSGQQGNLLGWQTAQVPNSRGAFYTQTGTLSPLSLTTVPAPTPGAAGGQSLYRAMLDQSNLIPVSPGPFGFNQNSVESYAGSNFLYQLVTLPASATALSFSIDLYIQSLTGFTSGEASLFYNNPNNTNPNVGNDQQVRVDIMNPNAPGFAITDTEADGKGDILQNIFQTNSTDRNTLNLKLRNIDLSSLLAAYGGKQVLIRIATVNNMGPMIVGVDNVGLQTKYADVIAPTFPGQPQLRNPGYLTGPSNPPVFSTTDPTLIGRVADDGGVNNIAYVAFSPTGDTTFNKPGDFRISALSLDPTGNFSVTLPNPVLGLNTVSVEVVDQAGNVTMGQTINFIYQGPSVTNWQAVGPGSISTANTGSQYTSVAGRINSVLVDPQDPSGNTYLIGSDNGGVWKTTDGGADWTPATDYVFDKGNPINVPVGALAGAVNTTTGQYVVYAATGDATPFPSSRAGSGILVSTNGGNSFVVAGNSDVVLAGARISKMAVDPNNTNIAYAAVASGGQSGPGIYKTTDGGQTWVNVLTTTSMNLTALGFPAGTTIASVTDMSLNSHDSSLLTIGLGNIGLVGASATAGVWTSQNSGLSWQPVVGGLNPNVMNSTLPGARPIINPTTGTADPNSGIFLGRVTLGEGFGTTNDISTLYVLISSPPAAVPLSGNNINFGTTLNGTPDTTPSEASTYHNTPTLFGLYKNGGEIQGNNAWTHVMIREQTGGPSPDIPAWHDLDLTGVDGSNVGAIIVDPTDPNVVYVGASEEYPFAQGPNHGLLRIDTGDMLDVNTLDPITLTYVNNGDDIQKRVAAYDTTSAEDKFEYPTANDQGYIGEGVSWTDLSTNAFNNNFSFGGALAPPNITSVAIDAQHRIIFGTEQGLYRLVYQGTGYDFTSGGNGIIAQGGATGKMPSTATVPSSTIQLTAINGNLQIADLTSVAIDPSIPGRFYTTQFNTGAALIASGVNSATTMGLTGFIGIPDGDRAVVGNPTPGAPPGTLNTVYEEFAYGDKSTLVAFQPTASVQGGVLGSFINLPTTNLGYTDQAGYLPVLTEYPQKVFDTGSGQYFDELLLGTDRIYVTKTSAGDFTQVPSNGPLSKKGGYITAATFAPTNDQIIYAGTNKGEVFVTLNKGGDFFQEIDTGLPANGTINSITVNPTNPLIAYVTIGGVAGSRIFEGVTTVTAGKATTVWTNITGNLAAVGVNALVVDPRSQPGSGAPNGRLYVGTDVGVYVSVNNGGTWALLGVGLPHVPVIDLQFSQNLEELVAGTQGRGAFMISTDRVGPHVVSVTPATPVNPLAGPLTSVTVTFNEAIGSFPLNQVTITGPGGNVITPLTVTDVSVPPPGLGNPHNVWQITFAAQSADGIYTFKVGPNVTDVVGNPMDQNQNGINGENPGDIYTFTVDLNSTDNGRFVTGLYNDLLGRPADTTGFENVLAPIDAARYALLPGLASAYVTQLGAPQLINDLYQSSGVTYSTSNLMSILGVGNLVPGVAPNQSYFQSQLAGGASFESIIVSLASSIQYFTQTGLGRNVGGFDSNFVTQVYEDLLNRAPTSFELNTLFVPQLANAESAARTQDARNLEATQAYQTNVISADYNLYLKRNPSSGPNGDIAYWLGQFQVGVTQDQLVASLLGSPEYFTFDAPKVVGGGATPSTDTWIRAVYAQLFPNYTIHPSEESYWDSVLVPPGQTPGPGQMALPQAAFILDTSSLYRFGDLGSNPNNFVNGSVDRAYKQFLGRDATSAEITHWQQVYAANPNYRVEDLDAAIIGSGEYFAKNTTAATPLPSQEQQWANALYTSVLGAPNSSAEQATDLPFLATADFNARGAVVNAVVGSPEYRTDVIDFIYESDLHRAPAPNEVAAFLPIVGAGASAAGGLNGDEQFLTAVLSSQEYFLLQSDPSAGGLHTNNSWLLSLYPSLHVPVNAVGEAANLGALIAAYAPTRLNAIQLFVTSAEYRTDFITTEYQTLLGRAPGASEVTFWLGSLGAGTTPEQLIASLIGSPEFFTRSPIILGQSIQPTNTTLVEAAYQVLFPNYTVSTGEVNFWVNQLNAGSITALQMATILDTSTLYFFGANPTTGGYVNGLVNRQYVKFLGRNAGQPEINYWMSVYNADVAAKLPFNTLGLIETILDTNEYFQRTHQFP